MAVKIKMLKERLILIHNVMGEPGKTYKVNNEVGRGLVSDGDAEYLDKELGKAPKTEKYETASMETPEKAVKEKGVSVVVATMPCYLVARRTGELGFTPRKVVLDEDRCNGCKICITYFGCPSIHFSDGKATIDYGTCVDCGMCVEVCKRGAITWN